MTSSQVINGRRVNTAVSHEPPGLYISVYSDVAGTGRPVRVFVAIQRDGPPQIAHTHDMPGHPEAEGSFW